MTHAHDRVQFPPINKQGGLAYKVATCVCMFVLNRMHYTDDHTQFAHFCEQHGVYIQHVICIPFYCMTLMLLALLLPSCFLYYSHVKALHSYLVHLLVTIVAYYGLILLAVLIRPQSAALLSLVVSVHVAEKSVQGTGERLLYHGRQAQAIMQAFAMGMILFAWMYLPLHIHSSLDFIASLFLPEVFGIIVLFIYYFTIGTASLVVHTYSQIS